MAYDGEGTIRIPLPELMEFASQYHTVDAEYYRYGKPTVDGSIEHGDLVISFAFSTECDPADWSQKPLAVTEWEK